MTNSTTLRYTLSLLIILCMGACQAKTVGQSASSKLKPLKILTTKQAAALQALLAKTKKNLVFVRGGSFQMGDFGPLHNEEKLPYYGGTDSIVLHKVTLDSFSMSAYKSTYEDFDIYTEVTGQEKIGTNPKRIYLKRRKAPAEVRWETAVSYCKWLGQQIGVPMNLPTEAQWEFSARNRGQFFVFATDTGHLDLGRNLPTYEWLEEHNRSDDESVRTSALTMYEVGLFPPNPLGFYDMASNGFDWTLDWYDEKYYTYSPELNPTGPTKGTEKVRRGNYNMTQQDLEIQGMTIVRHPISIGADNKFGDHIRCVANSPNKIE